jgi:serine/threonine protein kinase
MARLGFSEAIKDDVQLVMTGEIGSYLYMAPEVLQNEPYSEKVDIFSLAIVMFEMFSMIRISAIAAAQGEAKDGLPYAGWVASGNREPLPNHWPQSLKACLLILLLANLYCYIAQCVHPWII